ncbi:TonB-dependent receptor [Sphingomonas crusticola]|uniref:TonB-dependent receptor n=1 Tax=Sphingomonas crusticola TaxID=1697973 RepID=UPI0013C3177B|nr:TonB-dependent receptor [Sphingomonas crusticola]
MTMVRENRLRHAVFTAATVLIAVPVAAAAQTKSFDIPVQPAALGVSTLARQADIQLLISTRDARGKRTNAIHGVMTIDQALQMLLKDTGLQAQKTGTQTWTIVPFGVALASAPGEPGNAGDSAENAAGADIVVTGSRIRGAPIASPVIRIDQEDIRNAGQSNLGDVVRSIPQSFGGGQNPGVGSNVPANSGFNLGSGSSINLRGIGSAATLTLLNGHRLSYSGSRQSIDVSAIPLAAVSRIEIVPDGASALYGSDAVAGVANIVLRRDTEGLETSARIGTSTDGGAFEQRYGASGGWRWNSGGFIASYEFARTTGIFGRDRSYAADKSPALSLLPPIKDHDAVLSAHQDLAPDLTLEFDGLYNRRWSTKSVANNIAGNVMLSGNVTAYSVESYALAPTLRLTLGHGWSMFATGSYGRDLTHYTVTNYANGTAPAPTIFCYCNTAASAEIGGDGTIFALPAGPVKLALGAGYRRNALFRSLGPGNAQNIDQRQDSYYGYGELSIPIISPAEEIPLISRIELSSALRYEDYRGIGDIVTPKLGIIYAPTPDFDIKGSWGKSFRAPTLLEKYQARTLVLGGPAAFGGTGFPPNSTDLFVQGGNPNLKPERATTWSATLAIHPRVIEGAHLDLTYFHIDYRDRVVTPIAFIGQSLSNPIYSDRLTPNPSAALLAAVIAGAFNFANISGLTYDPANVAFLIDDSNVNAGRQTIHGVDAYFRYRAVFPGKANSLTASFNASYLESEQQITSSQPVTLLAGQLFSPAHFRARGGASWDRGPFNLTATLSYIGGVDDPRATQVVHVGSMTTLDLATHYRTRAGGLLGRLDIGFSVFNVLNDKPMQIATTQFSDTPYDSTNYSPLGRVVSVSISKQW